MVVKDGRYSATVKILGWPRGRISVWVGFQTLVKGQPAWVKTLYGELGDKMEGPDVKLGAGGTKRVEIEKTLVKP